MIKQNDLDDNLADEQQDHKSLESDSELDQINEGFELNLRKLSADTSDLSFLTKFMTNFKKIKNVDLGQAKASKKDLEELTKVVQSNPYIQEMKMNVGRMSALTHNLLKKEL